MRSRKPRDGDVRMLQRLLEESAEELLRWLRLEDDELTDEERDEARKAAAGALHLANRLPQRLEESEAVLRGVFAVLNNVIPKLMNRYAKGNDDAGQ